MIATREIFTDKNVRIAMQNALNVREINFAYYEGSGDPAPYGVLPPGAGEALYTPYAEWPEDVKASYRYDPEAAENLLDAAGFPRGSDGIRFPIDMDICLACGHDLNLALLLTSYWDKIGVDVTVNQVPTGEVFYASIREGTSGEIVAGYPRHSDKYLPGRLRRHAQEPWKNNWGTSDAVFDALEAEINTVADPREFDRLIKKMNMHYVSEMWSLSLPVVPDFVSQQPWLKGYDGDCGGAAEWCMEILGHQWVDLEMQKDLGHQ